MLPKRYGVKTMIDYKKIEMYTGEKRFQHILRVVEAAEWIAKKLDYNIEKAKLAALFHDVGKIKDKQLYSEKLQQYNIVLDDMMEKSKDLAHGLVSAAIAKEEFGICDQEVLDAIAVHTIGRKKMTLLDKIVYLADYIEEGRKHESCKEVRQLFKEKGMDEALLKSMDYTISYVVSRGELLHPQTVEARNELLLEVKGEKR